MRASRTRRTLLGALVAAALVLSAVGCTGDSDAPAPDPGPASSSSASEPAVKRLTFGVSGPPAELAAYRRTVQAWNTAEEERPKVRLLTWPDADAMRAALASGDAAVPDVFLASRADLSWLLDQRVTQPVDELLDERGVDFGDSYSRDALQAFSADDRLQCMPYGVSPMVVYYNKDLVKLDRMRKRELDVPDEDATRWSFDQFAVAAQFATRPRRETKGVHIDATLEGLAPFIESGGGSVFDDDVSPTSLTFSSDDSRSALERTLELLRNPQVTLDDAQLEEASPLTWFKRGRLGMIAGFRSLVPELRRTDGLEFDVLPMPVLDSAATVGDVTGLCLSRKAESLPLAADFLVYELSPESVSAVARSGYLAPANLEVALSDDFLQPGLEPEHASFFNSSVRSMRFQPFLDSLPALEAAVHPELERLVYGVGVLDLEGLTEQIDEESRAILDPEPPSDAPSDSASPADSSD